MSTIVISLLAASLFVAFVFFVVSVLSKAQDYREYTTRFDREGE